KSRVELDKLDVAKQLLELGKGKITLPEDFIVAEKPGNDVKTQVTEGQIPANLESFDIGPKTRAKYAGVIAKAATVVWNVPGGQFGDEPFAGGNKTMTKA